MNKRKLIIGLVTFAGVLFIFGVYNLLVDTPEIIFNNEIANEERIVVPDFGDDAGKIGDTKIVSDGKAVFMTRDEKTKQIKRVFGFDKLLNPSDGGNLWQLQRPYMKVMEDKFKCDIRSKKGKVRVETVLGDVTPVMAELAEEVEILIQMREDNKEIKVSLDDLIYDNERCAFSSEGPVKIVSDDGIMEGTGMIMIYDGELGKLAYLEIMNLKYLLLKNVAQDDSAEKDATVKPDAGTETVAATDSDVAAVNPNVIAAVDKPTVNDDNAPNPDKPVAEDEKYKYYQCRLQDNVNIEYAKRLVIVGADEVTISNILWSDDKDDEPEAKTPTTAKTDTSATETIAKPTGKKKVAVATDAVETKTKEDVSGSRDVYVTCNGSLIVSPMELIDVRPERLSINNRRMMEFTGTPLRVGQLIDRSSKDIEQIATCGAMTYDIDHQVLDLITNDTERYVELAMTENQANIYTQGSVKWNRRDNNALIVGPGMLLMQEKVPGGQASNMKFDGVMKIFFAGRSNGQITQQLSLSAVNLVGGMLANINKDGRTTIKSDMADFKFADGRRITRADLNGNVDFTSDAGRLNSRKAKILFAKNDAGKSVPVTITGSGDAVLEPKEISGERPTRFHAQKIDYDMLSKKAVATGPVKFMFYAPEKDDNPDLKADAEKVLVPVVITAQKNAKFFPEENQVVFNGSVVGSKMTDKPGFVQRDSFYGDQLIVDIAKSEETGKDEIKHVRVVGGLVELRSKRTAGDVVTNYTGLACLQIDYDADTGVIIAKGDGGDASEILINNENAPEPEKKKGKKDRSLDIEGPCVASVSGFKTLTWNTAFTESKTSDGDLIWMNDLQAGLNLVTGEGFPWLNADVPEKETLIVDGGDGQINIGYIPFKNGQRGQVVRASTKHLTGKFAESTDGKLDIVWLKAKDGITYEDGVHRMMGDSMLYTDFDGIMVIRGTENEDCIVDGGRVPHIEYNMKTGKIKSKLSSRPGIIQMR